MITVFEVHLVAGADDSEILSEEVKRETMAQVMTTQDAAGVGFDGFPDDPNLRLIAVAPKDAGWIEKALERSPVVSHYKGHEVPM